ncbi:MAG: hypothetical protein ABI760_02815 [Ferruginibacter sp.]
MKHSFSRHLSPVVTVYDYMDEMSAFKNAPPSLILKEKELFDVADIVFTGGHNLFRAKKILALQFKECIYVGCALPINFKSQ